jgi:hypothetical protein
MVEVCCHCESGKYQHKYWLYWSVIVVSSLLVRIEAKQRVLTVIVGQYDFPVILQNLLFVGFEHCHIQVHVDANTKKYFSVLS